MTDRVGQRLGTYRLTRLLGRGGFAEVYLGEHLRLGTQAAVKVLYARLASKDDVEGFEREARTVAHLKHPHIVRVLDYDVEDDTPFLVMDYLPNGNIRRSHPKGTPLPVDTIVTYVKQVASALQYAHDEKLIHRDIKPENMLLDRDNSLVLSDFGIALMAQSSRYQSTQEVAGTAAYMAPEQFQGKPRRASDQYALGIVVYEWLTGDRPFHGSFSEIASQHLFVSPPLLREKVRTISPDIERVVLTALEKDPHKRFTSVQAFANALERACQLAQSRFSILSQAPTTPDQPRQSAQKASPVMPLSQHTIVLSPSEVVHTPPAPSALLRQPVSVSSMQSRLEPAHQGISRRTIVLGLGVAGLAVAGGGLTWLISSQGKHPSVVSSQTSTFTPRHTPTPQPSPSPTPTPIPLGMLLYTYRGHSFAHLATSNAVRGVTWSPNSKRIASAGWDMTVQVWDATNGGNVFTYKRHTNAVYTVAWSPDGKRIASAGYDQTVQVWDAVDGGNVYVYHGHSSVVRAVAWSPDGKRIASGDVKTVQVWNAVDGGNVFTYQGHTDQVFMVAWSPSGRRIASASSDKTVQVWDATNGGNVFTYQGHTNAVVDVVWSPDDTRIASGSDDRTVQVWDATNGGNVFTYQGHTNAVYTLAWSPDGSRIASAGEDSTVQVWGAG